MHTHALVPLIAAAANLGICIPVLRRGLRQRVTRAFVWMTFALIGWNLDLFCLYHFNDPAEAEWWSRLFRTAMCFGPVAAYHFALAVAGSDGRVSRAVLGVGYAASVLLAIANLHGDLVSGVGPHIWGWYPIPTRLYSAFSVLIVVYLVLMFERMIHAYRRAPSPRQRVQARFCLLAAVVQTPLVITNVLPLYGVNMYPLGSLGNVVYIGIVAYAIARHRLMDVDYVVRKVVSFALAITIVLAPGGFGIFALARALDAGEPVILTCAALTLALLAIVLVPTMQQALETQLHRALFPTLYDYRLRLRNLGAALVHILDEDELLERLGDSLSEILSVESCHILVRDEPSPRLTPVYGQPAPTEPLPDEVVREFETQTGAVLASELETRGGPAAALFRARGWEAAVPLRIQERLTGLVVLGRNRDLRIFSAEDLGLLESVAAGASVALENVSLSRQLRRSEVVLERANQLSSLGMLAAGIAHEIRNPLVAVKTFLDLLPQRLGDQDFIDRFRELSLGEIRRVTDLIADLLALGKSKTAARRMIDVAPTLESVTRLMESTARKRHVTVGVTFAPALPPIWADADQLKQITLNLLLNAIESSAAGGRVVLDVRHGPSAIVLEVRDQGAGIPPEQLETIFHPFFTTKESGTGLGLSLVHQMVVEHGGEITVESSVGRGTVFRVTLPLQVDIARTGT